MTTLTDEIVEARIRKRIGQLKERIDKDRQLLAILVELLAEAPSAVRTSN